VEGEGGPRVKTLLFRAGDSALGQALLGRERLHLAGYLRAEHFRGNVSAGFILADGAAVK
jgi:hypothetical protein